MTELQELEQRITTLFLTKLNLEPPSSDADLVTMGIMDSLALVDLLLSLQQELDVDIDFDAVEIDNFRSVTSIAEYVLARRLEPAPASA